MLHSASLAPAALSQSPLMWAPLKGSQISGVCAQEQSRDSRTNPGGKADQAPSAALLPPSRPSQEAGVWLRGSHGQWPRELHGL